MKTFSNLTKFIITAFIKNIKCEKKRIVVEFETAQRPFKVNYPKTKFWLQLKKGQTVQIKVIFDDECHTTLVFPTFFDFRSRCYKCGRFYKLYCKHCYERFKAICAIIDCFKKDYLKGIDKYLKGINEDLKTNYWRKND